MSKRIAVASLVLAAVFTGFGILFANQNLSAADQIASVASFFVSLGALGLALFVMIKPTDRSQGNDRINIYGSSNIQTGKRSTMNIYHGDRRRRRWFRW
jgi:hypothetical protein